MTIGDSGNTVRLYIVEQQELFRSLYRNLFQEAAGDGQARHIELVGISHDAGVTDLKEAVTRLMPDVLLFSARRMTPDVMASLDRIRSEHPSMGVILLMMSCHAEEAETLRRMAATGEGGLAFYFKYSLDATEQLFGIIRAVSQRQVILDPALVATLFSRRSEMPFLKQVTGREMEILGLIARGCTNTAIAETLCIDVKTVEHHINNMYSKLKTTANFDSMHSRVGAARLYLEATGELQGGLEGKFPASGGELAGVGVRAG
ncbi:MAG: response regulator transcription factor [Chloroflexi bacterium]|nr:response regulator transcription factor [Chloroflexota bacterium]